MNKPIELLAPGGDIDSIKAAIAAGADAVYCGVESFNARKRATNLSLDDLFGVINLAHKHNRKIFLTLNILILESEIRALFKLLNRLVNSQIDGVIVQDLGLFYLLRTCFKTLDVHASTQMTTHNKGQIGFLSKLGVSRVNLSRELSLAEIKSLSKAGKQNNMLSEVFVHGANCIGFSGLCYFSSVNGGKSGNRGQCSQPCRGQYQKTPSGTDFPLNMKDNSAYLNLPELIDTGANSLKIEGRIKKFHYVYSVTHTWRKQLDQFTSDQTTLSDNSELYQVFNRDFTNCYLSGKINPDMFIDNSRDYSARYFLEQEYDPEADSSAFNLALKKAKQQVYDIRTEIINRAKNEISNLSIAKIPLSIVVTAKIDKPLDVSVSTTDKTFTLQSGSCLKVDDGKVINYAVIEKILKSLGNSHYVIEKLQLDCKQDNLTIPLKEINDLKKDIFFRLNNFEIHAPVEPPKLNTKSKPDRTAKLSLLISSEEDLTLLQACKAEIYFKLPETFSGQSEKMIALFLDNPCLIPWFPPILIGDDYQSALEFIRQIRPHKIVSNNTGIAFYAYQNAIDWIAGPFLNLTNSFSLTGLKEVFNCRGGFISNELNQQQIRRIKSPENFELCYSIYHPDMLLESRQCLIQQTLGCKKAGIDIKCLNSCKKSGRISNLNGATFIVDKHKASYPALYSQHNYFNPDIVSELNNKFDRFLIDLSDIQTDTEISLDKTEVVNLFEKLISGDGNVKEQLKQSICPTSYSQYFKGL